MKYFFKEWIIPALIALGVVFLLNTFVFRLVTVPTGSMETTIMPGDRLYVNKIISVDKIERGDIIVFDSEETDKYLVKRTIGLPGETVEIKNNGEIFIDGQKIDEPYAVEDFSDEQTFVVPEESYFFIGDNRPFSKDARDWENPYIHADDIIGEAVFVFYPFSRIGFLE